VLATGLLGLALLAEGHRAHDPLHARVYGPFMLVAIVAAYGYRTRNATANIRVFAAASLVVAALGLRAFWTG
jgi:ABC-type molybdate transport system substrate-binding protein